MYLLLAFADLCLKRNIRPAVSHLGGEASKFTILADKISRNLASPEPSKRETVELNKLEWLKTVRERSLTGSDCVFEKKKSKRLLKNTAKGGEAPSLQKRLPKRFRAIRKDKRRKREMTIALEIASGKGEVLKPNGSDTTR